ncbi:MAG: hypothetical protein BroJett011_25180 [Chloroflexota bacterium]|nr:MAG: hypothetical protein BroJett011_25180 [Chloroflexota bacterium]
MNHSFTKSLIIVLTLLALIFSALGDTPAYAATYSQAFNGTAAPNWVLLGTAQLTENTYDAGGAADGWLRLTNPAGGQAGAAVYNIPSSIASGFDVEFDYAAYGGSGADGITFYLIDGTTSPSLGATGGGLGYQGVTGAYFGVGFSEWINQVSIMGSASMGYPTMYAAGYPVATGSRAGAKHVRITFSDQKMISVWINGSSIINNYNLSGITQPGTVKFGFSGATGGSHNIHEIKNFVITQSDPPTVEIVPPITSNGFDLFSTINIADPEGDLLSGSVDILRFGSSTPDTVTFQTLTTSCGSPSPLNLTLNGATVGSNASPTNCTCSPGITSNVFSGAAISANFLPASDNTWGYNTSGVNTYSAWAKAVIHFPDGTTQTSCLFDRTGSSCTTTNLCAGYLYGSASGSSVQPAPETILTSQAYSNSSLPAFLDTSSLPSGSYTLRVRASDGTITVTDIEPFTLAGESRLYINEFPEMAVIGNGQVIADGDATPSLTDYTDFGSALLTGGQIIRSFTIGNSGTANLNLTGTPRVSITGPAAGDFSVTTAPASPVAPGGTTTFQVTFDPSALGVRSATLSIANTDGDENPYDFAIQGTGTIPPTLTAFSPVTNTVAAPQDSAVVLTYSAELEPASVTSRTVAVHSMMQGVVTAAPSTAANVVTVTPNHSFFPGELVYASATTRTTDITGTHPLTPTVWQFNAAVSAGHGRFGDVPVDIGGAVANTYSVAWGDMDHDGDLDLAAGNDGQSAVYPNNGDGSFGAPINIGAGTDKFYSLAWGDMDHDGDLDLAAGNNGRPNYIYPNNGDGSFGSPIEFDPNNHGTYAVAWGDMDGDGDLDIAAANYGTPNVVFRNNGNGTFNREVFDAAFDHTLYLVWADFDGDGDLDIVVANNNEQNKVYFNNGQGVFSSVANFGSGSDATYELAAGDVDGDGDLDLAAANDSKPISVYLNNGHGSFGSPVSVGPIASFRSVAWGDVDHDGDLDLAAGNYSGQNVVYPNNGGGSFGAGINFGPGNDYTNSVAWGDVDNDGDLDLAAGNFSQKNSVWLNEPFPDVAIVKTVSPASAVPGDTITYTLAFSNMGGWADGVTITDRIPVSLTVQSVVNSGVVITNTGAVPAFVWQVQDLAPGASGIITLTGVLSDPLAAGIFTNTAIITTTSIDSAPANNTAEAGVTVLGPEMAVLGNNVEIADGDVSPTTADHTDFGSALVDGGQIIRTFTIRNSGAANLTVGAINFSGPAAGDFSVTTAPTSPVAPGGTTTFQVTFDPSAVGPRVATLSIANDDGDENPYNFDIQGIGTIPLVFSEIMYNPASVEPAWEWVEVYNAGSTTIDLAGFVLDDDDIPAVAAANIAAGSVPPGQTAILYNADVVSAANFQAAWGNNLNLVAVSSWPALGNPGNRLTLWNSFTSYGGGVANAVEDVLYADGGGWPSYNNAASIYLTNLGADNTLGAAWALSTVSGSTPTGVGYRSQNAGGNSGSDIGSPGTPFPTVQFSQASYQVNEDGTASGATVTLTRTGDTGAVSQVQVTFTDNTATGGGTDYTSTPINITFPAGDSGSQTVTVPITQDFIDETTESLAMTVVSVSNAQIGSQATAALQILDDDTAGVTVTPSGSSPDLTISEPNGGDTFNIRLTSEPTADVTIDLTLSSGECSVDTDPVKLDGTNWQTGVTVTVTAVDDPISDGPQPCNITTAQTASSDPVYSNTFNPADVTVTVNDDDVPGVTIVESSGGTAVTEGGATDTYTVRLNTIPTATVTINIATGGQINPVTALTFAADSTALDPQSVTIAATDDTVVEGDHSQVIGHSASGGGYDGVAINDVTAALTDNDLAYAISSGQTTVSEGNSGPTAISFTLTRSGAVTTTAGSVEFSLGGTASGSDYNNVSPTPGAVSFSAGQTQQQITLDVLGDFGVEPDETIIVTLSNASAPGSGTATIPTASAQTSITNDDSAGFTVSPTSGLTTTEASGTASFSVRLNSQPTAAVTVTLTSNDPGEGTPSPASLVFSPANWASNQTVTVTGQDDLAADGDMAYTIQTGVITSDPDYLSLDPADVVLTNLDNDTPGYTISPNNFTLSEGGSQVVSISLYTPPTADVTIHLSSSDPSQCTVSPASVTLNAGNYQTGVSFTVSGVYDGLDDGNQPCTIITEVSTTDSAYAGLDPADINLTVSERRIYLPLIVNGFVSAPDLVVTSVTTGPTGPSVTIRNAGNAAMTDAFWVDVYFNPNPAPPPLNRTWQSIAPYGAHWGVIATVDPGASLTLTIGGPYFAGGSASFPAGAQVYAYVDSINYATNYGNVQESSETNNVFGPVVSTASGSLPAGTAAASIPERLPKR